MGYDAPASYYSQCLLAWSAKVLVQDYSSLLGRQAFLEGATGPAGPHAMTIRLGPKALRLALPCLNHPSWDNDGFTPSLSGG
jgi:hypothetical protein